MGEFIWMEVEKNFDGARYQMGEKKPLLWNRKRYVGAMPASLN